MALSQPTGTETIKVASSRGCRPRSPWRRLLLVLLVLAGLPACVYLSSSFDALIERLDTSSPEHWPREEFSPEAWRAAPADQRYRLYHDLDARRWLYGRSRGELFALLGRPSERLIDRFWIAYEIRYEGGDDPPRGAHLLFIEFDRADRVKQYYVTRG